MAGLTCTATEGRQVRAAYWIAVGLLAVVPLLMAPIAERVTAWIKDRYGYARPGGVVGVRRAMTVVWYLTAVVGGAYSLAVDRFVDAAVMAAVGLGMTVIIATGGLVAYVALPNAAGRMGIRPRTWAVVLLVAACVAVLVTVLRVLARP